MSRETFTLDQGGELEKTLRLSAAKLKALFKLLNRFMVGMFRLGLGPYIGNPYSGYIMVLTTTGRRSGLRRRTPVNYAEGDGEVYCLSGFGRRSDWYRNLLADPNVDVWIGSEGWRGRAEVMTDEREWLPIYREIVKRSGFADRAFTKIAYSALSDEELIALGAAGRVVRIRLRERLPKEESPGDLSWLWAVLGGLLFARWLVGRARRRGRRR